MFICTSCGCEETVCNCDNQNLADADFCEGCGTIMEVWHSQYCEDCEHLDEGLY
jgi:hypothetical protein